MNTRPVVHGLMAVGVAGLLLSVSGSAWRPALKNQEAPVRFRSALPTLTVARIFSQGVVTWRQGAGRWRQSLWTNPPSSMPTPLRVSLGWVQDLVSGQWPGPPLPASWAAWAGHVEVPRGWVVGPTSGRSPGLSVLIILPARAPYQGAGAWYSVWTAHGGHWTVAVAPPTALSKAAVAALLRGRPK